MTDAEPHQRRSRLGWALRTEPTTTPAGTHDHGQRNGPLFLAFGCIVGLVLINVGLVWFILARGETRDARERQMRDQIRDGYCELLDAFPADPLLDDVRRRFECGPGRPVEDFPPEVQRDLGGGPESVRPSQRTPDDNATAPPPTAPVDPSPMGGAQPVPQPTAATPVPSTDAQPLADPEPPPTDPLLDLSPVEGTVCDLIGVLCSPS